MPLLERDLPLQVLQDYLAEAASGHGRFVVVAGEAGAGKTAFVDEVVRRVGPSTVVAAGTCDGSATPAPLAPLAEMLPALPPQVWPEEVSRPEVFTRLRHALRSPPDGRSYLLVVEDVHWADEATLDLLRHLARRVHSLHAVVLVTYRPEDVPPGHPLRIVLGDVATAAGLRRVDLPPLSADAVASLVAAHPTATVSPAEIHRVTCGNAFFVSEVIAGGGRAVPPTVRDAVLARTARLSDAARRALDVVALVGPRAEPELLAQLLPDGLDALDEPLAHGVLQFVAGDLAFRHELARMAVAEQVPAIRRIAVHRAVLAALESAAAGPAGSAAVDHARLAHHAEAAGRPDAVRRHATVAAERAAALGAHREAAEQYRRVLRHADGEPPERRAELLGLLSYECYLTDAVDDALAARREALGIWEALGNRAQTGDTHRWLSRLSWFCGQKDACDEHARLAVEALEGQDSVSLAMAYSNLAQIAMLAGDLDVTRRWGRRALDVLDRVPPTDAAVEARVHVQNNLGTIESVSGDRDLGRRLLGESLTRALDDDLQEHAARAYVNLVSVAVTQHRDREALALLEDGLDYCLDRDLDSWTLYLQGWHAQLLFDRGHPREALAAAERVLRRPGVAAISRLVPLTIVARVRAGLGDPSWADALAEAVALADETRELQRLAPVAATHAEVAWLTGAFSPHQVADRVWPDVVEGACPWHRGMIATWVTDAGSAEGAPSRPLVNIAPPYLAEIDGRWVDAAAGWEQLGRPHAQALALARSGDRHALARAVRIFDDLDLPAASARVRAIGRSHGWSLPRGARPATREHPAGLTPRETDLVPLLAEGLSDAAIAERLVLSRRTVEHHVASILAKLGVASRRDVAAGLPGTALPGGPRE